MLAFLHASQSRAVYRVPAAQREVARETPSTSSPERTVKRRAFLGAVGLGVIWPRVASGAPSRKVLRVGVLSPFSPASQSSLQPFRDGLRELGHREGQHIAFEYRWADGKPERLPELAAELVRDKVDVLLCAWGTPAALAAKNATTAIPVVVGVGDPVRSAWWRAPRGPAATSPPPPSPTRPRQAAAASRKPIENLPRPSRLILTIPSMPS